MVLGTALSSCIQHFFFINCVHFIDYSPILHLHSSSCWILWILYNHFPRKDILSIMPAVNVSSNTSKKKKLTVKHTIPCRNSSYLCSNTSKDSIIPKDYIVLSEWWHQMKKKNGTGHSSNQLYSALFLYKLRPFYWL